MRKLRHREVNQPAQVTQPGGSPSTLSVPGHVLGTSTHLIILDLHNDLDKQVAEAHSTEEVMEHPSLRGPPWGGFQA